MNAQQLFALAPYGAIVRYSDGTPRPPERFKNKLRDWKSNNSSGRFIRQETQRTYSGDGFVLQTRDSFIIVQICFGLTGNKTFEIEKPVEPGTILCFTRFGADIELQAGCANESEARKWWERNRHSDRKSLQIVQDDGSRAPYVLPELPVSTAAEPPQPAYA